MAAVRPRARLTVVDVVLPAADLTALEVTHRTLSLPCAVGTRRSAGRCDATGFRTLVQTTRRREGCRCKTRVRRRRCACRCPRASTRTVCANDGARRDTITLSFRLIKCRCVARRRRLSSAVACRSSSETRSACARGATATADRFARLSRVLRARTGDCGCAARRVQRHVLCWCAPRPRVQTPARLPRQRVARAAPVAARAARPHLRGAVDARAAPRGALSGAPAAPQLRQAHAPRQAGGGALPARAVSLSPPSASAAHALS